MKTADTIRSWRWRIAKAGLYEKDFCQRYGFYQPTFSNWVNGKSMPKHENLVRVEEALKDLGVPSEIELTFSNK